MKIFRKENNKAIKSVRVLFVLSIELKKIFRVFSLLFLELKFVGVELKRLSHLTAKEFQMYFYVVTTSLRNGSKRLRLNVFQGKKIKIYRDKNCEPKRQKSKNKIEEKVMDIFMLNDEKEFF